MKINWTIYLVSFVSESKCTELLKIGGHIFFKKTTLGSIDISIENTYWYMFYCFHFICFAWNLQ